MHIAAFQRVGNPFFVTYGVPRTRDPIVPRIRDPILGTLYRVPSTGYYTLGYHFIAPQLQLGLPMFAILLYAACICV